METRNKYEGKRAKMTVSFNKEREAELLAFARSLNFSEWVKEQLEAKKAQDEQHTVR